MRRAEIGFCFTVVTKPQVDRGTPPQAAHQSDRVTRGLGGRHYLVLEIECDSGIGHSQRRDGTFLLCEVEKSRIVLIIRSGKSTPPVTPCSRRVAQRLVSDGELSMNFSKMRPLVQILKERQRRCQWGQSGCGIAADQ